MKKYFVAFAALALMATACGTPETTTETTVAEQEAIVEDADTTVITEIDNTAVEIEAATEEVDSLLDAI